VIRCRFIKPNGKACHIKGKYEGYCFTHVPGGFSAYLDRDNARRVHRDEDARLSAAVVEAALAWSPDGTDWDRYLRAARVLNAACVALRAHRARPSAQPQEDGRGA
jgi:hypothetical protein